MVAAIFKLSSADAQSSILVKSHSLNSLKGGYIGDCIGDYFWGY